MKTNLRFTLLTLLAIVFYSCVENELLTINPNEEVVIPLHILALVEENGKITPTDVEVEVSLDGTVLGSYSLNEFEEAISFPGSPNQTYELKISKPGYATHITSLTYDERMRIPAGKPLKVLMKPALELQLTFFSDDGYSLEMQGSGVITVVWPDNSTETHSLPVDLYREMEQGSGYNLRISGDLTNITDFRLFGYNTVITEISGMKHLKGLERFSPGRLFLTDKLDLHHNRNLIGLDLFECRLPEWFKLPQHHSIKWFTLSLADRLVTTNELDMIVNSIYKNAERSGIYNGILHVTNASAPSAEAVVKSELLLNKYNWEVNLNY